MQVSVKIEGIADITKLFQQKRKQILDGGERVIKSHNQKILKSAKSKINNISGETAESLKERVVHKGQTAVVSQIGTLGGTKEEAIRANSLEYGHAAPGKARGTKIPSTTRHAFIRPALDEDKKSFKQDMTNEIKKVIETG